MTDTTRRATLIISAKDEASRQVGNTALKFTELNQAIEFGQKVMASFKAAFDFAKEGAAIERIHDQWEITARDFGFNADKIASAMTAATDSTVDDEALIQAANRAMTQGVVQDAEQLVKFVEIARASAVRFGGDAASAFEQILRGTEYGAQRMLKSTVGVVDFAKAYDDLALRLGKRKADLTDEEQLQARVNAVLETGQGLVAKVGDTSKDAATQFEQFDTSVDEMNDSFKQLAATLALPTIQNLNTLLSGGNNIGNFYAASVHEIRKQLLAGTMSLEDYNNAIVGMADSLSQGNRSLRGALIEQSALTDAEYATAMATRHLTNRAEELNAGMHDNGLAALALTNQLNALGQGTVTLEEQQKNAEASIASYNKRMSEMAAATENSYRAHQNLAESLKGADRIDIAKEAIKRLQDTLVDGTPGTIAYAGLIEKLQLQYGLADKASLGMVKGLALLQDKLDTGLITNEQYAKGLANLPRAAQDGVVTLAEVGITTVSTFKSKIDRLDEEGNAKIGEASARFDKDAKDKFGRVEGYYNHLKQVALEPLEFKVFMSIIGASMEDVPPPQPPLDDHDRNRARGGPVMAGRSYRVGENGPETLVMGNLGGGYVIPNTNNNTSGRGQTVINLNYYGPLPGNPAADVGMLQALAGGG